MIRSKPFAIALVCVVFSLPSLAQSKTTTAPPSTSQGTTGTNPQTTGPGGRRVRREPCWQQAGISQSVIQERRQIEQNTRSQIESVCQDSSLSQQQKREKIRQIHEQARSQMEGLINPQQKQALESCRAQRGEAKGERGEHGGMHRGGGEGPCGELAEHSGRKPPQGKSPQLESEPDQE